MVKVPTVKKTKNMALESGGAAIAGSLGNTLGRALFGQIGGVLGTTLAATAVGGSQSKVVTTVAMYDFFNGVMSGAGSQQNSGNVGAI